MITIMNHDHHHDHHHHHHHHHWTIKIIMIIIIITIIIEASLNHQNQHDHHHLHHHHDHHHHHHQALYCSWRLAFLKNVGRANPVSQIECKTNLSKWNPSTVPSMQSTLFLPHCPVGWVLLRGIEKPQNWIVAGQEGDVLKPGRFLDH